MPTQRLRLRNSNTSSSKPVVDGRAQRQFGIEIPTLELMDLATVAKLGRRIADRIGISPAATPALTEAEPHADADDEPERSAEPALELTFGRLLEQELDRVKERAL
jgi:hypothetical protein